MKKILLKNQLRRIYSTIRDGFQDYDCGHELLCHISSDYYNLCKSFNETADELAKIDSNVPSFRYKL